MEVDVGKWIEDRKKRDASLRTRVIAIDVYFDHRSWSWTYSVTGTKEPDSDTRSFNVKTEGGYETCQEAWQAARESQGG